MKAWHWIAIAGVGVVAFLLLRRPATIGRTVVVAGPTTEARAGRGHF